MSIKVVRERPDQRRHHRVTAPLWVMLGGHSVRAADWSLGGLRVEAWPGAAPAVGQQLALRLSLPFQGFDVAFDVAAEVVRLDPAKRMFAVKYLELGQREAELMRHFIEELVRGSMVEVTDTIQRIDVPITPVSTAPDSSPKDQVKVSRWPLKTILYTAFYLTLGIAVFGYTVVMAWSNIFRMEVQTAVITSPLVTVQAPGDGHVMWTQYKPGDAVRAGAVVLQVADNELERSIDLAEVDIREKQARLELLQQQQGTVGSAFVAGQKPAGSSAGAALRAVHEGDALKLRALKATSEIAEDGFKRMRELYRKGYATRTQFDLARTRAIEAVTERDQQRVEMDARASGALPLRGALSGGSGARDTGATLADQMKLLQHETAAVVAKRDALLAHRVRLAVVAPYDGVLMELPRVDHAPINRGDIIAVLEQPASRQVTAYLTQDESLRVGLGDTAMVYIPSFDTMVDATVQEIDRTSGFVEQMDGRYGWRGTNDRSARATLMFKKGAKVADMQAIRAGTPAIVLFESRSTNQVVAQIRQGFRKLVASVTGAAEPAVADTPDARAAPLPEVAPGVPLKSLPPLRGGVLDEPAEAAQTVEPVAPAKAPAFKPAVDADGGT
jgi:multidrug resistance efflux pump